MCIVCSEVGLKGERRRRQVHIYRFVSEATIEENISRKADQKRVLDFLAIQSAGFTSDKLKDKEQAERGGAEAPLARLGGNAALLAAAAGFAGAKVVDPRSSEWKGNHSQGGKGADWNADELAAAMRDVEDDSDRCAPTSASWRDIECCSRNLGGWGKINMGRATGRRR